MYLDTIISLFLIRYLRRHFQTRSTMPRWDKLLLGGMAAAISILVIGNISNSHHPVVMFLGHGLSFGLVYLVFKYPEFRTARTFVGSIIPVLVISVLSTLAEIIAPTFYEKMEDYFEVVMMFALMWVVAMWIITRKQRKALEEEREQRARIEREQIISEKIKAELEQQVLERTAALTLQKEQLEHALADLQATQSQLVQSEKMASLGELTAGIAHEIQNPLNFINNFSELNAELIDEMKAAMERKDYGEVSQIVHDIALNENKINHHGKRADAIVKGMLLHSRSSGGIVEAVNINELADEYLRLSYHGLRAKDKSFNATLKTDLDPNIGTIKVVPEDIGRVLLNLMNNAFYAVTEKKKLQPTGYEPTVELKSRKIGKTVQLTVKDNGSGIPEKVLDKIFQPFFTTKPAGQGTGLGLSLSYDIVKAHGGDISVETSDGEGTEFLIELTA